MPAKILIETTEDTVIGRMPVELGIYLATYFAFLQFFL